MPFEPDAIRRKRTYIAGQRAEWVALLWLAAKGYRVLARRYAVRGGEVDLVLRRGTAIVFVEVKARPTIGDAITAITPTKCRRIERAAAVWLARNPWAVGMTIRGDILAVAPWRCPQHLQGGVPLAVGY